MKFIMSNCQRQVEEFHNAFNIYRADYPSIPDEKTKELRINLIREELEELETAFNDNDLIEVADALADLLYVVYVSCGINMKPIFDEVHRSNMTKVGGHKREDGKWIKPKTYSPPDLSPIITAMILKEIGVDKFDR